MFGKKSKKAAAGKPGPAHEERLENVDRRIHSEGLGDPWVALTGRDPAQIMPQIVGTVLHGGGTRPAWQWTEKGQEHILMAWPQDQPIRAAVLMVGAEGKELKPVTAVPLIEGLPNDLEVESSHPRQEGLGGDIAVSVYEGKKPMWFFDPLFGRDRQDLTPGVTHTFWLGAIALKLRKALLDEVALMQGPEYEEHAAAWLKEHPERDRIQVPPLKINVRGQHFIMPGRYFGEYQIRATVEDVEDWKLEEMPIKALYLAFPLEDRAPLRLPLFASRFVLGEYEPVKGDEIEAIAWFEGRIIDLESS